MWLKMTSGRMGITAWSLAVALLALSLRSAASAEHTASSPATPGAQPKPASLATLVRALGSSHFQEREQATFALLRLPPQSRGDIEDALARETDPEAVARLTRVAVHLLLKAYTTLNGPTPLLGVSAPEDPASRVESLPPALDREIHCAVVIASVQAGFPAAEVLEAGDRIIAIDNRPFPQGFSFDDFHDLIKRHNPGSFLNLTILRDGKTFKAPVQLAGLPDLNPSGLSDMIANRMEVAQRYVESLKTGLPTHRLILSDNTPDDSPDSGTIIRIDP